MSFRFTTKTLFGAAAMVAFGASLAAAQSTGPKSTRRIPISKDQGGEVMKTDTITVYKTDTLRLTTQMPGRVDTVRTTMTNTVTVHDTVTMSPPIRLPGGLYFGIGGGVSAPNGSLYNPNSAGPSAQVQLGWQGAKNILGLRGDVNYTKPGEDGLYSAYQADPEIVNFSADAKLQLPFMNHLFGATHRFALYGIGGYTHTMFKNLPVRVENGGTTLPNGQGVPFLPGSNDWTHVNGWNAGGGASLGWGRTELFVETRVLAFSQGQIPQARQMPFVLGINFY
jgi:hypothetical protein